jgi:type VI secretion system secreted protein VgrG
LKQATEQAQWLSDNAKKSDVEPADVQAQIAMITGQLEQLKEAVALISAPQGIALASGKHLQLMAADNLMLNAGGRGDISIAKRLFMGIGQGLSLFVNKLGIKLVANQGPVTVQAQNDKLEIFARLGLQITSSEDEIHITAKKKVVINGGGSYITLDQSGIESGTEGAYKVKSPTFDYTSTAVSLTAAHPAYTPSETRQPLLIDLSHAPNSAGSGLSGMPYSLYANGLLLQEGVLSETAKIQLDHQVVTREYRLELASGVSFQIPATTAYRNPEQAVLANRGVQNHPPNSHEDISWPLNHTDHRQMYAGVMGSSKNKEEPLS